MANLPDVNEAFAKIVFKVGYFELAKKDGPIACGSTSDQNQVLLGGERSQLCVRQSMSARPHFGFVLVPVVT